MDEIIVNENNEEIEIITEDQASQEIALQETDDDEIGISKEGESEEEIEIDSATDGDEIEVQNQPNNVLSYNRLTDKPSINDVELQGNKTFGQLGIHAMTNLELSKLLSEN